MITMSFSALTEMELKAAYRILEVADRRSVDDRRARSNDAGDALGGAFADQRREGTPLRLRRARRARRARVGRKLTDRAAPAQKRFDRRRQGLVGDGRLYRLRRRDSGVGWHLTHGAVRCRNRLE